MSNFSVIETDTKMLIDDTTDNFTIAQEIADEWFSATGVTCQSVGTRIVSIRRRGSAVEKVGRFAAAPTSC